MAGEAPAEGIGFGSVVLFAALCFPLLGQSTQKPLSGAPASQRQLIAIKAIGSKRYSEADIAAATGLSRSAVQSALSHLQGRQLVATSRAQCVAVLVASPALFQVECKTPRQIRLANAFCRYFELATPPQREVEGIRSEDNGVCLVS